MNFFKSVFSEDPDPPKPESPSRSNDEDDDPNPAPTWSFGGLIKTLATQSESVIETYRRDLQEFGSGLKKEIEVAQGSIGTVGTAIDELGSSVVKGTAEIIAQGRDAILNEGHDSDSSESNPNPNSKPYSRFESQVRAIQGDPSTYNDEPEDSEDYLRWKLGFALEEKEEEIEELIRENGSVIDGVYDRVGVDRETFWCRYFYKVRKLKQAEGLRASLAMKRAIPGEEDEDLSWDVDDDDDEEDSEARPEKSSQEEERSKMGPESDEEKKSKEEEEEVGWDEIEDLSNIDEKKIASDEISPKIAELRKRLSAAEDEDLSWDIEDLPLPPSPKA